MSTSFTNLLGFALPTSGELDGSWGDVVNASITELVEDSIAGSVTASVTSADWTLSTTGSGAANQARSAILIPTGTPGVARSIFAPNSSKAYIVNNQSNATVTIKGSTGPTTGAAVAAGTTALVAWNGSDFVLVSQSLTNATGTLPVSKGGTGATTLTGVVKSSGTNAFTAGNVNLSSEVTGTLPAVNGGTGQTTYADGQLLIGNGTGNTLAKSTLTAGTGISITNGAGSISVAAINNGTVTSVGGTGTVNGISLSGTVTSSGNLTLGGTLSGVNLTSQVTGTLPVANGGTGSTSTTYVNLASNVTGTLPIANGGTGATTLTANNVLLGNGTSALQSVAPGASGNVLTSNGTTWTSATFAPTLAGTTDSASPFETSLGYQAGNVNTGVNNTFIGYQTGLVNTTGINNTAMGSGSLPANTSGNNNVAIGHFTLDSNTTGGSNLAIGTFALQTSVTNSNNLAIGGSSLLACISDNNVSVGVASLISLTTGASNTGIGYAAGSSLIDGSNNTMIGNGANVSSGSVSNTVTLGNSSIATLRCQVTTITALSDARDKTDVKALSAGLDFVNELKPVSFTWNMRDGGKVDAPDTGFIAQDLQAVQAQTGITIPGLVDAENPDRLEAGYGKLLPVLARAIQELSAKIDAQAAEIAALKAGR